TFIVCSELQLLYMTGSEIMKVLTIIQSWDSLITLGDKHIETRLWRTKYRGSLLIHAGKT
ncbi:hypothetical protein KM802_11330, partial [Clostridium tyrobutyricum]|nr:hypothetical protein [Clostridium tyrobutyricum]